jgi:hypothetical protein
MAKKKNVQSFEEFLTEKKKEQDKPGYRVTDWDLKKEEWLKAIDELYGKVDKLIVDKLREVGYVVDTEREETRITEDFIGSYTAYNYIVRTNRFKIRFCPIACIMIQYNGRVDMILPKGSAKLILNNNNRWMIADRFAVPYALADFDEANIQKIFEDYL